jgi:cytosine deaminase
MPKPNHDLLLRGGRLLIEGRREPHPADVAIRRGRIASIAERIDTPAERVIDLNGMLISPPFVESHVHLDSALIDGGRCLNQSGTLFEGIEIWRELKRGLTFDNVVERATQALRLQAQQGVLYVRSHADVSEPSLTVLKALLAVRERVKRWISVQIVAFPQDGLFRTDDQLKRMDRAVKLGVDAIGGIPHYELTREDGVRSVHHIFDLARRHNRLIDVHCDEIDDPQSRFLEVMAACAIRQGNGPRVTASHTTAMGSYDNGYANKLIGFLRQARINIIANPLINIVLQGRTDTYPKRRGLTRVKELHQAGLNVSLGYDCIMDPWYALGTGNMLDAAHMAAHACQMMGAAEIDACYDMVTWSGARTLALGPAYDVAAGNPANLVVLDAGNRFDAIRRRVSPRYVISRGQVIVEVDGLAHIEPA